MHAAGIESRNIATVATCCIIMLADHPCPQLPADPATALTFVRAFPCRHYTTNRQGSRACRGVVSKRFGAEVADFVVLVLT